MDPLTSKAVILQAPVLTLVRLRVPGLLYRQQPAGTSRNAAVCPQGLLEMPLFFQESGEMTHASRVFTGHAANRIIAPSSTGRFFKRKFKCGIKYEICRRFSDTKSENFTFPMPKILLVEDENLLLRSLSSTLKHDGLEVTAVANGKDALNSIKGSRFDICFLDVKLPDANGLNLMNQFREISPQTQIIIMTAVDLDDEQLQLLARNATRYLPKPFELEEVRSLVKTLTKNASPASPA